MSDKNTYYLLFMRISSQEPPTPKRDFQEKVEREKLINHCRRTSPVRLYLLPTTIYFIYDY